MARFLLGKLGSLLLLLLATSVIAFLLPRLVPGDAAVAIAGPDATREQIQAVRAGLGLDRSPAVQYVDWLGHVLAGDFGKSLISHRPVAELIRSRLGSTVEIATAAAIVLIVLGTGLGVLAGSPGRSRVGTAVDILISIMVATPPHVIGLLFILIVGSVLPILPISGEVSVLDDPVAGLQFLTLPALALGIPAAAVVARLVRARMRSVWTEDFVALARAKGVPPRRILVSHVLRNSLGTAVVAIGIRIGELLSGAVVIEAIFARNGLGLLGAQAVESADYQVVQIVVLGAVAIAAIVNLAAEACLAALDPRIRLAD